MKRLDTQSGKTIDYSASVAVLEEFYQKQYELIKAGNTDLATFELVCAHTCDLFSKRQIFDGCETTESILS